MEFKGTKGKWVVADYEHCLAVEAHLPNGQEHTVFTDQFCYASKFNGDAQANALLISKAPELLNALIRLLDLTKEMDKTILDIEKLPYADLKFLEEIQNLIKEATEIN